MIILDDSQFTIGKEDCPTEKWSVSLYKHRIADNYSDFNYNAAAKTIFKLVILRNYI